MLTGRDDFRDVRIVVGNLRPQIGQCVHQGKGRRFPHVVNVLLVGQSHEEDATALHRLGTLVEGLHRALHHPVRHTGVDFSRQFDEARVHAILPRLPGQVIGIDGDAVPAQARSGVERLEPERLGRSRLNHFPDVNAHPIGGHLQFVHQSDVHGPVDIFQQLGELGHLGGTHRNHLRNHRLIESLPHPGTVPGDSPDHLGNHGGREVGIAGILPLRGVHQEDVRADHQSPLLDEGSQFLVRGPGIGCAFQAHHLPGSQMRHETLHGAEDKAEVGLKMLVQGRGHAHDERVRATGLREIRGDFQLPVLDGLRNGSARNVLDVTLPCPEGIDLLPVDVDPHHLETPAHEAEDQGEPDVTQAHHPDHSGTILYLFQGLVC